MVFRKLDNWNKDFRHKGLLFFTQLIDEIMDPKTCHIFKIPVPNTHLLADEYLKTSKLVEAGIIKGENLKYVLNEFLSSFSEDLVVKSYINEAQRQLILQKVNTSQDDNRTKAMEYVMYCLSDYDNKCKQLLLKTVQTEDKKTIEHIVRCFIPGMIDAGYSSEFIYHYNIEIFNRQPVNSFGSLRSFLDRFDFIEKQYDVYIAIAIGADKFREVLKDNFSADFGPFDPAVNIQYDKENFTLVKVKISALDEYSAAKKCYNFLNIFFTYYRFMANQADNWCQNNVNVIDYQGVEHLIQLKDLSSNRSDFKNVDFVIRTSVSTISVLLNNARQSYTTIEKVYNIHNTAIENSDIKNRFLNFWSILEIVFVLDRNQKAIQNVVNNMLPILQNNYIELLFSSISFAIRDLSDQIDFRLVEDYFKPHEKGSGWHYFMFLEENEVPRKQLYTLLTDYPLLQYRIAQLEELCKDKTNLLIASQNYTKTVSWLIYRLYRNRNSIVHSGDICNNLEQLTDHLHKYVDLCLGAIVYLITNRPKMQSISNAIIDISLKNEELVSLLNTHSAITRPDIGFILMNC